MAAKIKLSYEYDQELEEIEKLLAPMLRNVKVQPAKGKYKRAYIDLKNLTKLDMLINADKC